MSIRDILSNKTADLKRKLMDYKITTAGTESQVIKLHFTENKYGDETVTIIEDCIITADIDYPSEMPLYRLRANNTDAKIDQNTGVYFYDIIPIEILTRWEDRIEKGDILIKKICDENDETLINVLRISEVLGAFNNNLVWRKCQAAPHNLTLTQEIVDIIEKY